MSLIIRVTMPDGSEWDVPADLVAHNRADSHASRLIGPIHGKAREAIYKMEKKYAFAHHNELIDWATNNMNWADVKTAATMHKDAAAVDYEKGWNNGDKRVIKVP